MKYIKTVCPMCNEKHIVEVSDEGFRKWQEGAHVQDAFPELPASEREMLITGTCDACWAQMFSHHAED